MGTLFLSIYIYDIVNQSHWNEFLHHYAFKWKYKVTAWASAWSTHPVLVVRFEDVREDMAREVRRMLAFLGVPFGEEDLRRRLAEDFTQFRRVRSERFDPYTADQKQYVLRMIAQVVKEVGEANNGSSLGLERYML